MGMWGVKALENDGAADWVDELVESGDRTTLLKPLKSLASTRGPADLDDSIEGLAGAEIIAGSRHEPVRGPTAECRKWVREKGFAPTDAEVKLTIKAVARVRDHSQLADSWRAEERFEPWAAELDRLTARLQQALRTPAPNRTPKPPPARENVAQLVVEYGQTGDPAIRLKLRKALEKLSNVNRPVRTKGYSSLTPLHWVASRGLLDEAQLLISRGANVDSDLPPMARPIGFAIEEKHPAMVTLLMRAGADRNYAVDWAAGSNDARMLRIVCNEGGDFRAKGTLGRSAIHQAALTGADRCVRELISMGSDINEPDNNGDTPLHYAAMFGRTRAVKTLLESGANIHALNSRGQTALDLAREDGFRGVITVLARAAKR
jgi:ankyrin repeat protein